MPLPITIMEQALGQDLSLFRDCFSQPQGQHVVTVLLALLPCEEQRTRPALRRKLAGVGSRVDGLARFFKDAPWPTERRVSRWWRHDGQTRSPFVAAEHIRQRALRPKRRGRPRKTVVPGFLILDDSPPEKPKGKKREGLGRPDSSSANKTVKGHRLCTSRSRLLGRRCPLAPHLDRQQAVCDREKVPFPSKLDRADEVIWTFAPVSDPQTPPLVDRWSSGRRLGRAALSRGGAITGGLKANRKLRVTDASGGWLYRSRAEQRATLLAAGAQPGLTIGQTRWHPQKRHQRLLLDWIPDRYAEGQTSEQIHQFLAA